MPNSRARFTIRGLMIAIAAVALLMAMPVGWALLVVGAGLVILGFAFGAWVELRGHRRVAAVGFVASAVLVNVLYVVACTEPDDSLNVLLLLGWLLIFAPTIGRLGVSWGRIATRERALPRRSRWTAWPVVIGLTLLPGLTALTDWPLYLAFAVARPVLDRIADRALAGPSAAWPQWAGPYRLVGSSADPVTGQVSLFIDPNPNGPSGFVREIPGAPPGSTRMILGTWTYIDLGGGWSYRIED